MSGGAQLHHRAGWLPSALLALWAASAQAAPAAQATTDLPAPVQAALEQAGLPATALGVVAFPLPDEGARAGGKMMHRRTAALRWQAEQAMAPSSSIKILSAVVALDRLGAASRGRTELLTEGPPDAEGRLAGPLYLRGGADAQLDWGALWLMLRQAREQGVREVPAGLVLDRSLFRPARPDTTLPPFDEYPESAYNVVPDALMLNGNLLGLSLESDSQTLRGRLSPAWRGLQLDLSALAWSERPCADWELDFGRPQLLPAPEGQGWRLRLQGSFPRQCQQRQDMSLVDRQALLPLVLRSLWEELGGSLGPAVQEAVTPASAQLLAQHQDRPLGELLRGALKSSDNPLTRLVYLRLGASVARPGEETLAAADRAVREWLAEQGLDAQGLVLENGSGLSRRERIRPELLAAVLARAARLPLAPELQSGLPLAGVDGTLRRRLKASPAAGRARLKTGSLNEAVALAGYVPDRQGRPWVLVAFVNHEQAGRRGRPVLDAVADWVARQSP
ncbi:MAG: D-alanyl-D-alanine carboxypeptidase/D-alanyl-D-alanine-endopeptidase [Burkholderiales bacterium PBB2]|nr:MAG: D-alanyl-D-alanine carboxypeptidase/D-alanyl-D-alanine-endopeptidase [Burkholderiales bacterium PBB2]